LGVEIRKARELKPIPQPAALTFTVTPQCSPATTHYFISDTNQVLAAAHLPNQEGWKAELA